jgi:hypothetical protein
LLKVCLGIRVCLAFEGAPSSADETFVVASPAVVVELVASFADTVAAGLSLFVSSALVGKRR